MANEGMESKLLRRRTLGRDAVDLNESLSDVGDHLHVGIEDVNPGNSQGEVVRTQRQMPSVSRREEETPLPGRSIIMGHLKSIMRREVLLKLSTAVAVLTLVGWGIFGLPLMVSMYNAYTVYGLEAGWVGCYGGDDYSWPAPVQCNTEELLGIVKFDGWNIQNFKKEGLITAHCRLSQIDTAASSATLSCNLALYGTYFTNASFNTLSVPTKYNPRSSLVLVLGRTTQSYSAGESLDSISSTLSLGWRNNIKTIYFYPFFDARFNLFMSAYWLEPDGSAQDAALAWLFEYNDLPPYLLGANVTYNFNNASISIPRVDKVDGEIRLHLYFKMFAMILVVTIWLLVLALTLFSVFEVFGSRTTRPSFDLLSAATALLFALPSMRGVLPGNPPVGTQYDIYGTLGQLTMITVVCLCLVQHRSKD